MDSLCTVLTTSSCIKVTTHDIGIHLKIDLEFCEINKLTSNMSKCSCNFRYIHISIIYDNKLGVLALS
jgi:hypothetical protein